MGSLRSSYIRRLSHDEVVRKRFPKHMKCGDIVAGLPIKESSYSGVHASHVLEHFSIDDFRVALLNTHRLLKQNGTFRLVVPDL